MLSTYIAWQKCGRRQNPKAESTKAERKPKTEIRGSKANAISGFGLCKHFGAALQEVLTRRTGNFVSSKARALWATSTALLSFTSMKRTFLIWVLSQW